MKEPQLLSESKKNKEDQKIKSQEILPSEKSKIEIEKYRWYQIRGSWVPWIVFFGRKVGR